MVVVARPGDRSALPGRHELEEEAPGEGHDRPAGDRDDEDQPEVPRVPFTSQAAGEKPDAVDRRRDGDHARKADPVADPARDERRDDVPGRDGAEDVAST